MFPVKGGKQRVKRFLPFPRWFQTFVKTLFHAGIGYVFYVDVPEYIKQIPVSVKGFTYALHIRVWNEDVNVCVCVCVHMLVNVMLFLSMLYQKVWDLT